MKMGMERGQQYKATGVRSFKSYREIPGKNNFFLASKSFIFQFRLTSVGGSVPEQIRWLLFESDNPGICQPVPAGSGLCLYIF